VEYCIELINIVASWLIALFAWRKNFRSFEILLIPDASNDDDDALLKGFM